MLLQPGPGSIREEIEEILQQCRKEVEDLLRRKAHALEVLRDYLLVEGEITGDRFEQIMEALGEVRGGEEAVLRRPPKVLAPHRPRPAEEIVGGNGQGDGEIKVSGASYPEPSDGTPTVPGGEADGSEDGSTDTD